MPTSLPPERVAQLKNIIQTKVLDRFDPTGLSGGKFQQATSDLGTEARNLMHQGSDSDQRALGLAVQDAQTELRDLLNRTADPQTAAAFRANNAAYANMLRVQAAAGRQGAEEGNFTPAQLSSAVRQYDPTKHKSQFAAGGALLQDLSDAGKAVLGNKVPDSGTPFRTLASMLAGGVVGHGAVEPSTLAAGLGAGLGAVGAYSNPGRALLTSALTSRPSWTAALGSGLRTASPLSVIGTAGGAQR